MKGKPRIFNFLLVFVVLFGALGAMPRPVEAAAADLFISEYIEGSSYNKAVEIYNGTGSAVDLSVYTLELYSNGAASPSRSTALTGALADGDVYVLAHPSADPLILAAADVTNSSVINFNGDDAIALRKNGELVDAFGQIGVDPGTAWGSGETSTVNNTLRRKPTVCQGDPIGDDAFDPVLEWDGFGEDVFDGLGEHVEQCDDITSEPVINEFSASTTGTDVEYVEIYGDPGTDYSAYKVLEIEGDSGTSIGVIDEVIDIGTTDANGLFLADLAANALENGTISLLLVKDFTGSAGGDIDIDDDGIIDDPAPWSALVDSVAVNDGGAGDITYGTPVLTVSYDGLPYAPGGASRIPDGYDTDAVTDWVRNDFDLAGIPGFEGSIVEGEAYNTPGAPNEIFIPTASEPKINEFVFDHSGTDTNEYIEIFGDPDTEYFDYSILQIEGDSNKGYITTVDNVGSTDTDGFWWTGYYSGRYQNGTQTLLLVKGFNGAKGDDLDTNDDGIFDATPWSELVDSVAVNDGGSEDVTYGATVLGAYYDGLPYPPGGASRMPDGYDTDAATDWVRNDFDLAGIPGFVGSIVEGEAYNTPGEPNAVYTEAASEPVINEFSASTTGTDVEYVEIFGDPETDYSAYSVLEIEGDFYQAVTGMIDEVIPLGTTDANGLYLANLPANALENGTITLLLVKDFTGALGDDLDTNEDGVLDITPWSAVVDAVAVNDGGGSDLTYGTPVLTAYYDGLPYTPGGASRIPDGYDTDSVTDWVRNDFDLGGIEGYPGSLVVGEAYNTPGEPNMIYTPPSEACGDPFTPIYEIQGSGMTTPIYGTEVSTEGIVVGDFQTGGKDGYFIQALAGDDDPATSDGIFVYAPGTLDVSMGDHVRVRGYASEYYDLTQVSSVSQVWVCDTGLPLPTPIELSLPVASVDDFEPFEGMYVTFPQNLVISEYFDFDRYGEIVLTSTRHLTPTAEYEPGSPEAYAAMDAYILDRITQDDGRTSQNPDPAIHPNGMEFTLDNLFRGGDMVANVTGVLDYSYDLYRIQPTQGADYIPVNPRPAAPTLLEGDLKVASMNVLNYFTTIDTGADICSPSGDMECRGADDATELARQRAKILTALSTMNADVVGLIEIENDRPGPDPDYAAADLVAGLNDILGAGTYDYIATGAIGTDAIKVALIYKPGKVTPVGEFAVLDSTIDSRFLDDYNRPVLAQSFMDNWSEEVFTVAVNHLKSKGSECDAVGDYDLGDGAGNCNLTRLAAAQAEVDWLAADPTGSGFNNVIIIGDLNSYDKEDPIDAILAGPDDEPGTGDDYFDLLYTFRGEDAYSYVFDGQIGYLDYALANFGFEKYIDDVAAWHINADEPDLIDYDTSFKKDAQDAIYAADAYRSSDHDPVIVTFTFDYINVLVDILPGSCENPLNVTAGGVLPVVIPGTADFDVTLIDPTTVTLADISPVHWAFEDTSTAYDCSLESGDGYLDLVLLFDAQEIVTALGEVSDGDVLTLKFYGRLLPELGGIPVLGEDFVLIIKKGK